MKLDRDWDVPAQILDGQTVLLEAWPASLPQPSLLGFHVENGRISCPTHWQPVDREQVISALNSQARGWIKELTVLGIVGSTNTDLVQRAAVDDIDGVALLAELQLSGRGRRGRQWSTPLGGSLAISIGWGWQGDLSGLSGLSAVVGLAAIEALEQSGYQGIRLKWPNDLLVGRAKLGGILIELVRAGNDVMVVIGIGLNIQLTEAQKNEIEQATTSLMEMKPAQRPDRSLIAAALLSSIVGFCRTFAANGLSQFVPIFNESHALHGHDVVILGAERRQSGRVRGLALDGGLVISGPDGADEIVYVGEVSLRAV